MSVPIAAITIIKEFEGLFLKVYPDPLSGSTPYTVGFGCTVKPDGTAYNLGAYFHGSSGFQSITNLINTPESWSDVTYVTSTFIKYRNPGSNVEAGLKRRREAEAKLFLTKV